VAAALAVVGALRLGAVCGLSPLGYLSATTTFVTVGLLATALYRSDTVPAALAAPPIPDDLLSERELEVLAAMSEGQTNAEIAERLVIAESTVKSHVKNILRKLHATNRTEAVCWYCRAHRLPHLMDDLASRSLS
jgi:DNA-binding NarL/FixJ family response regulator